jgi:hypothetical protein
MPPGGATVTETLDIEHDGLGINRFVAAVEYRRRRLADVSDLRVVRHTTGPNSEYVSTRCSRRERTRPPHTYLRDGTWRLRAVGHGCDYG